MGVVVDLAAWPFPAHAGMNRAEAMNTSAINTVPRPRGDEP